VKVIIDFDGTLTAEETQVKSLAALSLTTLAQEILRVPRELLSADYETTRARLLQKPYEHRWEINGLTASYCDEGAFILNTSTLLVMLRENEAYGRAVRAAFPEAEYDPVFDCTNHLFHRHSAELPPAFRPGARDLLMRLLAHPRYTPIILTNSLEDKVRRQLATLELDGEITVLGDTRQYEMDPHWPHPLPHPELGDIHIWPVVEHYPVDLRRPAYYRALRSAQAEGEPLAVVADTFSLPGALPLMMGIPFFLLRTPYTPGWCIQAVEAHPLGRVLDALGQLPSALEAARSPRQSPD
jgi:hypothetical protein